MRFGRVIGVLVVLAGFVVAVAGGSEAVAAAGSVVVGDDFACTRDGLAAAIDAVATSDVNNPGLVTFDCADPVIEMTPAIELGSDGGPVIAVEIDGSNGGNQIVLDGGGANSMLRGVGNVTLILAHLTFQNGFETIPGGAVLNLDGSLTVRSCTFIDNYSKQGGAITSEGDLFVEQSLFSGNTAGEWGGALYVASGPAVIIRSSFYQNYSDLEGGAIYLVGGVTEVYASTFAENTAFFRGSTISVRNLESTVELLQSTVVQPYGEDVPAIHTGTLVMFDVVLGGYGTHCSWIEPYSVGLYAVYSNSDGCFVPTTPELGLGPLTSMMVDGVMQYFYPLLESSVLVDSGVDSKCYLTDTLYGDVDQLGVQRPLGDACDVGAIERPYDYELCVNQWTGAVRLPSSADCARSETLLEGPVYPWPVLCVNPWNGAVRAGELCSRSERSIEVVGDLSIRLCENRWNGALRVSDRCSRSEREVWL